MGLIKPSRQINGVVTYLKKKYGTNVRRRMSRGVTRSIEPELLKAEAAEMPLHTVALGLDGIDLPGSVCCSQYRRKAFLRQEPNTRGE